MAFERTRQRIRHHPLMLAPVALALWIVLAYVVLPFAWTHYEHQRGLQGLEMVTRTADGIPGDPLNVGLVGGKADIVHAMRLAGWRQADPVTLESSIEIADSVVLDRPDPKAPVSPLFYRGQMQHLAFEQEAGESADQRHHVRFWKVLEKGKEGRPVWLGSVTFDQGVGLSHYTGQITHHIGADVDAERDRFSALLTKADVVAAVYRVTGIGPTRNARNGGGDPYWTDGDVEISVLVPDGETSTTPPKRYDNPVLVDMKNAVWNAVGEPSQSAASDQRK